MTSSPQQHLNRAIWLTTAVLGTTLAIAGLHHGFFEALQGNRATPGLGIASIGPEQVRWVYGTDDAITLIPNFLATGIAAMLVSVAIMVWSMTGLRRRHGATGFLALFVVLTLVGGGLGHVVFFMTAWAYATRIRRPLTWWARVLRPPLRTLSSLLWLPALATSSILFLLALEASVFGYVPGVTQPESMLAAIWMILLASLIVSNVAYVAAIARDLGTPASVVSRAATPMARN